MPTGCISTSFLQASCHVFCWHRFAVVVLLTVLMLMCSLYGSCLLMLVRIKFLSFYWETRYENLLIFTVEVTNSVPFNSDHYLQIRSHNILSPLYCIVIFYAFTLHYICMLSNRIKYNFGQPQKTTIRSSFQKLQKIQF